MLSLFRRPTARPGRSRGRVVLRLEGFEHRDQPSDWYENPAISTFGDPQSNNQAPQIQVYCSEIGAGLIRVYGQVTDESPGGLTVRFGGIPSAQGRTTTTLADGSFSMILHVQTNGSDIGVVTAQTTDNQGLDSNVDYDNVNPTPPG
jgi:hypothetical protein